jgi:hypothetical protein
MRIMRLLSDSFSQQEWYEGFSPHLGQSRTKNCLETRRMFRSHGPRCAKVQSFPETKGGTGAHSLSPRGACWHEAIDGIWGSMCNTAAWPPTSPIVSRETPGGANGFGY